MIFLSFYAVDQGSANVTGPRAAPVPVSSRAKLVPRAACVLMRPAGRVFCTQCMDCGAARGPTPGLLMFQVDFFVFLLDDFFDFFFFLRSRLESDDELDDVTCRFLRLLRRRDFSSESDELLSDEELLLELLLLVVLLDHDRFRFFLSDLSLPSRPDQFFL